jgi:hypothetical protein
MDHLMAFFYCGHHLIPLAFDISAEGVELVAQTSPLKYLLAGGYFCRNGNIATHGDQT